MTATNIDVLDASAPTLPAFLDVPQTASHLGVHTALVYREIRAGRLQAVKIGAKVLRISREALEQYIRTQTTAYLQEQEGRAS